MFRTPRSPRSPRRTLALTALAVPAAALVPLTTAAPAEAYPARAAATAYVERTITDSQINESSGLARSTYARDILWTHNDSGDSPRVFAINGRGKTVAVVKLGGASARDWEDIASGPNHTLWVGDVGDNARSRKTISVYKFTEPGTLSNRTVDAVRYDFRYPDGSRNAESIMIQPQTGRLYIVSKQPDKGYIYRAPKRLSTTSVNTLERLSSVPEKATAASFAPGGNRFVVGTYTSAYIYSSFGGSPRRISLPGTRQGESLEFGRDYRVMYRGSEGTNSPVYNVPAS